MKARSKLIIILPTIAAILLSAILCLILIPRGDEKITLAAEDVSLMCGEEKEIEFVCSDENATISFESFNEKIVSVSGDKLVAISVGETSIRVKAQNENSIIYSSFKVTVFEDESKPLTDLPTGVTLYLLDKNFEDARADGYDNEISFVKNRQIVSTSSCKFAKVVGNKITALKVGSGDIEFCGSNGDKQIVKVSVEAIEAKLSNLPKSINLNPTQTYEISYSITPSYYTGQVDVKIGTTSECLSVEDNVVTAQTSGEGSISISVGGNSYAIGVEVNSQIKYNLTARKNCSIEGNRIYVAANESASFVLELFTLSDENISFSSVNISASGVTIKREINNINFSSSDGGVITIYSSSLRSYAYFYVCVC